MAEHGRIQNDEIKKKLLLYGPRPYSLLSRLQTPLPLHHTVPYNLLHCHIKQQVMSPAPRKQHTSTYMNTSLIE